MKLSGSGDLGSCECAASPPRAGDNAGPHAFRDQSAPTGPSKPLMAEAVLESSLLVSSAVAVRDDQLAQGDLEPYRRELTGYCYRMLGSGFEAEDAVQEAMLRAWRKADVSRGGPSVRSWLYRIATNVCIDMHRQRSAPGPADGDGPGLAARRSRFSGPCSPRPPG